MTSPPFEQGTDQQRAREIAAEAVTHDSTCPTHDDWQQLEGCDCGYLEAVSRVTDDILKFRVEQAATDAARIAELQAVAQQLMNDLGSERDRRVAAQEAITLVHVPRIETLEQALREAQTALAHLEVCRGCGEDSWDSCFGGQQAKRTQESIDKLLSGASHA